MFIFIKLKALFDAVTALAAKFPDSKFDVAQLFTDIETAILTKSWTLTAAYQVIADAEELTSDFAAEWTGAQADFDKFVADLEALFV